MTMSEYFRLIMTLCATFFSIAVLYILYQWHQMVKRFDHIPTPKYRLPIFGHLFRIPRGKGKLIEFENTMRNEVCSKVRVLWISFLPFLTSTDVTLNEEILKSMSYINKGIGYSLLSDWLGTGLVTSNGTKWKYRRHLLTPAFHFDILKQSMDIIDHHAKEFTKYIGNKFSNKTADVQNLMKVVSLTVISETAMGLRYNLHSLLDSSSEEGKYLESVDTILKLFTRRSKTPWLLNSFVYKYLSSDGKKYYRHLEFIHSYVRNVIDKRIKNMENSEEGKSRIFLDILINAYKNKKIDVEGIMEEVHTFMFAGHDTISAAMSWTLYLLGRNVNVQEKLFDEMQGFSVKDLTYDGLSQLKYFDCVIKESLRLHPPVAAVSRHFENDTIINGSFMIPRGANFVVNMYQMHRDKSYWDNPLEFMPERFLNSESRNPYTYVPFSAGPRNCIGQRLALIELKLVLFYLLREFHVEATQKEDELGEDLQGIHKAANGIWITFHKR